MPATFGPRGVVASLRALAGASGRHELTLRLFVNEGGEGGSPVEAGFEGYRPVQLAAARWSFSPKAGRATYPEVVFRRDADGAEEKVWGYYLTRGGEFVHAERFGDGPFEMRAAGDEIGVTPDLGRA